MKKIRFGIIGTNFITDWILEAAREETRFQATAVYSRQRETGETFARKHNIPHVFTHLEEMAGSNEIDAVYLASPNAFHASQSILFMEQGKHVLCEKPMASNATEARAMTETARKYGVILMEAMKSTLTPNFRMLREQLSQAGKLRRYFAAYCQYSSRYDKLKEGIVLNAFKPELSNGALMDLGVYTIYPMVVLFGQPQSISASGLLLNTGVDGQGSINFEYGEMSATVLYSKISDSYLPTEIQGEQGTFTLDRIHTIKQLTFQARGGEKTILSEAPTKNEYYYEIAEFIDLIEKGYPESEINSHHNSLITIGIMDEVRKQLGVVYPADLRSS